ncbi:hypothetical protein AGMMS50212_14600 [Spirochaetia bacterium]|nr:hypothetical protein AGMMS50212_14600 [Spirochaetia bacterium]
MPGFPVNDENQEVVDTGQYKHPDKKHFHRLAVFVVYILIIRQIIGCGILKADSLIRGVAHNAEGKQIFPGTKQGAIYGEKHIPLGMMLAYTALVVQVHFYANQSPVKVNLPVVAYSCHVESRKKRRLRFHCKGDGDSPFLLMSSKGRKKSPLWLFGGEFRQLQLADNDIAPIREFQPGAVLYVGNSVWMAQVRCRVKTRLEI